MHSTAMNNGKVFFDTYVAHMGAVSVVDVGSQDVNGSLREVCTPNANYIGIDFERAKGVDIVISDPYSFPLEDESVDVVVSSSCFEHSEMFWLTFREILRILRPHGLFYLNAPTNGTFHRYPVDCWRFYPDAGKALVSWARHCGTNAVLLESYVSHQHVESWNDFVAVFLKDERTADQHPRRVLQSVTSFENATLYGRESIINQAPAPQDLRRVADLQKSLKAQESCATRIAAQLEKMVSQLDALSARLGTETQAPGSHTADLESLRDGIRVIRDLVGTPTLPGI